MNEFVFIRTVIEERVGGQMTCVGRLHPDHLHGGGNLQLLTSRVVNIKSPERKYDWHESNALIPFDQWLSFNEKVRRVWPAKGHSPTIKCNYGAEEIWSSIDCIVDLYDMRKCHVEVLSMGIEGPDADVVMAMLAELNGIVISAGGQRIL